MGWSTYGFFQAHRYHLQLNYLHYFAQEHTMHYTKPHLLLGRRHVHRHVHVHAVHVVHGSTGVWVHVHVQPWSVGQLLGQASVCCRRLLLSHHVGADVLHRWLWSRMLLYAGETWEPRESNCHFVLRKPNGVAAVPLSILNILPLLILHSQMEGAVRGSLSILNILPLLILHSQNRGDWVGFPFNSQHLAPPDFTQPKWRGLGGVPFQFSASSPSWFYTAKMEGWSFPVSNFSFPSFLNKW